MKVSVLRPAFPDTWLPMEAALTGKTVYQREYRRRPVSSREGEGVMAMGDHFA